MASTSYSSTGAFFDTGIGVIRIHARINYSWSRSNNTITFSSTNAQIKYVRESGSVASFTYNAGWTARLYVGTSTQRSSNSWSGTRSVDATDTGSTVSFSVSVGKDATTYGGRIGAWFSGDSQTYTGTHTLSFNAAGSPSGQAVTATEITPTSAKLNASISNWGTYCTAGTGQRIEYRESGGSWVNLAYSTSSSHSRTVTGLKPGTTYEVRTYTSNGAGQTGNSSTITFKTKAVAGLAPLLMKLIG